MIINPTDWFQNEEIQLKNVETMDEAEFVESVRMVVQKSPYRSLLVIIHGFRERYVSALRKTAFLGHVLDINSPVLLFDWRRRLVAGAAVAVLLVVLFGALSLIRLPVQLTPEVEKPEITIRTDWRAAAPEEVEAQIIEPQEKVLRGLPDIPILDADL